jgi:transposase-like protein
VSRRQTGRRYTEAQRQEALELGGRVGFAEAGRQLGIPDGTLRYWASLAGSALADAERHVGLEPLRLVGSPAQPTSTAVEPWPQRRARMLPRLGEVAAQAIEAASRSIAEGKGREAQAFATTAGILIDKAQLLAGGATSRSESASVRVNVDTTSADARILDEVERLRAQLYGDGDAIEGEVVDDG